MKMEQWAVQALKVDHVGRFLNGFSLEISPRQADKIGFLDGRLKPGSPVYVAMIDAGDFPAQLAAVKALRAAGFEPVPHVPARFVRDADELAGRIAALAEAGQSGHVLMLGGGAPVPTGAFDATIQMLETGVLARYGITKTGFAGHPEGNGDITREHGPGALVEALRVKQSFALGNGLDAYIATQFVFEAEPVVRWAEALRAAGITMPIHIGVPGPATIKTLVKYAAACGVGNSARFLRKQALNVTKLLSVSAPDELLADLAQVHALQPELGIAKAHFYPFGGLQKLFDWLEDTH